MSAVLVATPSASVGLSAMARQAAAVASILGHTFSFGHVAAMLDILPALLLGPLEELVLANLIEDDGAHLAFRDDLVYQSVFETVPASARNALQRQAIDVLVRSGESPREPAVRLATAARVGDQATIFALVAASNALGSSDPATAADLCRRAFELTPAGDARRSSLATTAALLLHAADRTEDARAFADGVLRGRLTPEEEAEIRMSLAEMTGVSPQVRVDHGHAALALPELPDAVRTRHLVWLVDNLLEAGEADQGRALMPEATAAVDTAEEPAGAGTLQLARSRLSYMDGAYEDAVRNLDTPSRARGDVADLWRAELLVAADRFDAAGQAAAEGIETACRRGHTSLEKSWRRLQGRCLLESGRISDAAATLAATRRVDDAESITTPSDAAALFALGRIAIHTGDIRAAGSCASLAAAALDDAALEVRRDASWFLAVHAFAVGDTPAAGAHLARFETDDTAPLPKLMIDITDPVLLVRIARAIGDTDLTQVGVTHAEHRCEANPGITSLAACAAHARGLAEGDLTELAEACLQLEGGPRVLAQASAHEDHGLELIRAGERADGIEALGRALEIFSNIGATWDAARTRRRLRDLGVRRRLVKPTRPPHGWAGLTDSETAVAYLVAEGLKNREVAERLFVSAHTVSMHLRHVFTKLDINSRVELARLVVVEAEAA
jgi:DNA-binding CsgD family transcriptional regulator